MDLKLILRNTIGLWLIMTAVILPFPYAVLPSFKFASSDSSLLYILSLALIVLSIIVNVVFLFFNSIDKRKLTQRIRLIGTYILAFFLLKYGVDKLFQNQFYSPEPNILHTPIGDLTKDMVFWTSMSSSSAYNMFMGIIEVSTALLLFIPKLRTIAIILSIGITGNIFMINIGFDISVKFLSGFLLVLSTYLFSFDASRVYQALTNSKTNTESVKENELTGLGRLVKASVIGIILIECLLPFSNGISKAQPVHGLYGKTFEFKEAQQMGFLPEVIKRIHFNTQGYLITETIDNEFEDYRIHSSPLTEKILLKESSQTINYRLDSNKLTLFYNAEQFHLKEQNNESLPLLEDSFHWTSEGFID